MADRGFFETLKSKLLRRPSDNFDKNFWTKFEGEFGEREIRLPPRRRAHWLLRWAAAPTFAVLVLLIYANNPFAKRAELEQIAHNEEIPFERLIEQTPLIESLDLLLGPQEFVRTDFTALNEEEWKILLEGNG